MNNNYNQFDMEIKTEDTNFANPEIDAARIKDGYSKSVSKEDFESRNYFWTFEYNALSNAGYTFASGSENNEKGKVLDGTENAADVYEILVDLLPPETPDDEKKIKCVYCGAEKKVEDFSSFKPDAKIGTCWDCFYSEPKNEPNKIAIRSRDEFETDDSFTSYEKSLLESSGFEIETAKFGLIHQGSSTKVVDRRTKEEIDMLEVYDLIVTLNDMRNS